MRLVWETSLTVIFLLQLFRCEANGQADELEPFNLLNTKDENYFLLVCRLLRLLVVKVLS